jgi:hypothetical protein
MESLDLVYSTTRQLHKREVHHHVVRTCPELPLRVLEVLLSYPQKELGSVRPQMRKSLRSLSIVSILLITLSVFRCKAQHYVSTLIVPIEVRVEHTRLVLLIARVECLEHVLTDELIISVQIEDNRVRAAVVMSCNIDVLESSLALSVLNVCVA